MKLHSFSLLLLPSLVQALLDTSHLLSRRKRTLIYQKGLNWIQLVAGIGLPLEVADNSITMGAVVKSYYEVPNNSTSFTNPSIDIERRSKRSTTTTRSIMDRWQIYSILEGIIANLGHVDAKSCLLNSICQCARSQFDGSSGLLAELLHLLLTPSTSRDRIENPFDRDFHAAELRGKALMEESCDLLYPCDADFLRKFTQSF